MSTEPSVETKGFLKVKPMSESEAKVFEQKMNSEPSVETKEEGGKNEVYFIKTRI